MLIRVKYGAHNNKPLDEVALRTGGSGGRPRAKREALVSLGKATTKVRARTIKVKAKGIFITDARQLHVGTTSNSREQRKSQPTREMIQRSKTTFISRKWFGRKGGHKPYPADRVDMS